jgi:hypothetical protein
MPWLGVGTVMLPWVSGRFFLSLFEARCGRAFLFVMPSSRIFPPAGIASGTFAFEQFVPDTTPYTAPLVFGNVVLGHNGRGRTVVFVPRTGQEGAWFELGDVANAPLNNGVDNYIRGGWGSIVHYDRHESGNINIVGTKSTTSAAGFHNCFGSDVAHTSGTRGNKWTYTRTCSKFFANRLTYSNGGNVLVAIDGDPTRANGLGVKTVTPDQAVGSEFGTSIIASLPSPWNALSTLAGCKYIDCYSATDTQSEWVEVWVGGEGSHTMVLAPSGTNSGGGGTCRDYFSALGYSSISDTAVGSTYAPPRPGVNVSGRTFAPYVVFYPLFSMQELLEQYRPWTAVNAQFVGGNHTDGGTVSQESCSSGCYQFFGFTTSGSVAVNGVSDTSDIQNGDRFVVLTNPPQLVQVATPSGKTSNSFNLAANATVTANAGTAPRWMRADWTVQGSFSSSPIDLNGSLGLFAGEAIMFLSSSGALATAVVESESGSTVHLSEAVTVANGDYVVRLCGSTAHSSIVSSGKAIFVRPYEIVVASTNSIVSKVTSVRSHPELGTLLSSAAAKEDSTVSVTSTSGVNPGDLIAIYGPGARHVSRVISVSGNNIFFENPLPFGVASGGRITFGLTCTSIRKFRLGDEFSMYYSGRLSGYHSGDTSPVVYSSMLTLRSSFVNGRSFAPNRTFVDRAWVNANATSSTAPMKSIVMGDGRFSAVMQVLDNQPVGAFQTRAAPDNISKTYFSSGQHHPTSNRYPNSIVEGNFCLDFRDRRYL